MHPPRTHRPLSTTRVGKALTIAERRIRPLPRALRTAFHRHTPQPRPALVLGPRIVRGHEVLLRSPQLADGPEWSRLRIRDRRYLEPYWVTSELPWDQRNSESAWIDLCSRMRREERAGVAIHLVMAIDGRCAGQVDIEHLDRNARTAEVGLWLSSEHTHRGIVAGIGDLVLDHLFGEVGLERLAAAICVDNVPARHLAQNAGFEYEGTMADYLDVGGRRRDHDLWAVTASMWRADLAARTPGRRSHPVAH